MVKNVSHNFCRNCGKTLTRWNSGPLCYACTEEKRNSVFETMAFEDITKADYFSYSGPRFREKEKALGHIGTLQANGKEMVYTSVTGTQKVPLPSHSIFGIGAGSLSAIRVQGSVWCNEIAFDKKHPNVRLYAHRTVPQPCTIYIQRQEPVDPAD